jgi:ubiquitin thioesterase protein OTUB1
MCTPRRPLPETTSPISRYLQPLVHPDCVHTRSASCRLPFANPLPLSTQGPLVGEKTPSTAITEEYAKADPVYIEKTMVCTHVPKQVLRVSRLTWYKALPQTYSHYRPIQGDGNCGWRGKLPSQGKQGSAVPCCR